MVRDILTATGDGDSGREGLLEAATLSDVDPQSTWDADVLQEFIFGFDEQYRDMGLELVVSKEDYAAIRIALKDENGRSLFDTNAVDGIEYTTLFGHRIFSSAHVPTGTILGFVAEYFVVRTVDEQSFDTLREKFYPHLASCGLMDFGCAWVGPAEACQKYSLGS